MSSRSISPLCENWQEIAEECKALPRDNIFDVFGIRGREEVAALLIQKGGGWIKGWDGYTGWYNYGIALNYQYPLGDAGLPVTTSFLRQCEGIKFASLSILKSGALLRSHMHPENSGLTTFHLGLDVPDDCFLNVEGYFIQEQDGKPIVFDGTKPHYAFNASDKDRLILHIEFWPGLLK